MSDDFSFFDPNRLFSGPRSISGRWLSPEEPPRDTAGTRSGGAASGAAAPSEDDVQLLGRLIFAEGAARYKADGTMEGIGWTVRNRVAAPGFPKTLGGVVHQAGQFQGVGNPLWNSTADPSTLTGADALAYEHAMDVARGILGDKIPEPTNGATHFYSSPNGKPPGRFFASRLKSGRLVRSTDQEFGDFTFLKEPAPR